MSKENYCEPKFVCSKHGKSCKFFTSGGKGNQCRGFNSGFCIQPDAIDAARVKVHDEVKKVVGSEDKE